MAELTGQTFAGYEIVAKLGEGGMGAVYKARQPILNRFVALKTMAAHLGGDKDFVARFQREAASAATLSHPNVVGVHTAGEVDGTHYIVMEFVDGESVRKRLDREGSIPPAEALAITIYVAQALQYAWNEAKLIHRDIKPDNIFISKKGEVKVGDLGLAKSLATEGTEMTATGTAMGSPHYISPEQATGIRDIDFRTDIYSLGCTLYHMLTGQTPYKGDSSMIVMMKHVNDPPPAIFKAWPQCPMPLGMLVGRMLAKDRNARPKCYEQLVADLFAVSEKVSAISSQPSAVSTQPAVVEKAAAPALAPATSPDAPTVALQPSAKLKNLKVIYAAVGAAAVVALAGLFLWSPWSKPSTQDSAAALKQPGSVYKNAVGAEMVYISPGEFMIGSTKEEQAWAVANGLKEAEYGKREGDAPRKTKIKDGFWMGRTEVTVGQWKEFVAATAYKTDAEKRGFANYVLVGGKNTWEGNVKGASWQAPGFDQADSHPVCCVSWNDAIAFCEWLTDWERKAGRLPPGQVVRLPTEAEWEYACRAGRQTKWWWGDTKEESEGRLNWNGMADGFQYTSPVDHYGARGRNGFGLADMAGNVQEWCLDNDDATGAHEEYWKVGASRVLRSGPFSLGPAAARCAYRNALSPDYSISNAGFRVAVGVDVLGTAPANSALHTQHSAIAPDAGWQNAINLLPLVDPQKDAVKGKWRVQLGELIGGDEEGNPPTSRIRIPYRPPAEYDLLTEFTRRKGNGVITQILRGGTSQFVSISGAIDGQGFGFELVGGKELGRSWETAPPSLVRLPSKLKNGQRYALLVQVRKDAVKGFFDGRLVTEWKTDYRDMSINNSWELNDPEILGVGGHSCMAVFHRIEVREVTGKGAFTRAAPPTADAGWQNAINLLPLIDPQKDAVQGKWLLENGALRPETDANKRVWATMQIPYQPPEEYDFRIVFAPQKRTGVIYQVLRGGGRTFQLCIGGWGSGTTGRYLGFEIINGKCAAENPSGVLLTPGLESGRHYTSLVQVRKDGVKSFLDGRFMTEWKTDYRDMTMFTTTGLRDNRLLGIADTDGAVFHRIEVREVTGKGTFTRGAPAATSPQPLQTIDLLALVDPVKDRVMAGGDRSSKSNRWERCDGALVYVTDGRAGKIAPPVALRARSCEVEVEFERLSGDGQIHVDFPFEKTLGLILSVVLDAPMIRMTYLTKGPPWPVGKQLRRRVVVRLDRGANGAQDHVTVRVDGEMAFDWQGDLSKHVKTMINEPHPEFSDQPYTAIYSNGDSYKITAWTLRVFDGEATVLRDTPGAAPSSTPALRHSRR